eukprot:TRINITY_DN271_c4_g1_i1.p1 TRINITY_DN271_c4_g1~~TRINITY_DN271_c4_g1_i1.p1  ORF type:complete len:169 (+),score=47.54 TRINITY_DN271_c4_g1_i1:71-577(+)
MTSSTEHKQPTKGSECAICLSEIDSTNYVEYRAKDNGPWFAAPYCQSCLQSGFIDRQWTTFNDLLVKADCAAAVRRMLKVIPRRVRDPAAFTECKENGMNDEVALFWFASTGQEVSSALKGAPQGKDMEKFLAEKEEYAKALAIAEAAAKKADEASTETAKATDDKKT